MQNLDTTGFKWGIEHEFPLIKNAELFCDFSNLSFDELASIIETLPTFEKDYPFLRIGDLGIKTKRWYVEGFERFTNTGEFLYVVPKGMEIRTPVCDSLIETIETLKQDIQIWQSHAEPLGYTSASVAFNPIQEKEFIPDPPENDWEIRKRADVTEYLHMLTFGPDINFSHPDLTTQEVIDIGKKLTYYSPYIVPFSFSSPFNKGRVWEGLSRRTYYRTGRRPSVCVFIEDESKLIQSAPVLTKQARIKKEIGRIEFKAFDAIRNIDHYQALGTLLLGLALDKTLLGRAIVPDEVCHQTSARYGFDDTQIREEAEKVMKAVTLALPKELQTHLLPLETMLKTRRLPAHDMIDAYYKNRNIMKSIL